MTGHRVEKRQLNLARAAQILQWLVEARFGAQTTGESEHRIGAGDRVGDECGLSRVPHHVAHVGDGCCRLAKIEAHGIGSAACKRGKQMPAKEARPAEDDDARPGELIGLQHQPSSLPSAKAKFLFAM